MQVGFGKRWMILAAMAMATGLGTARGAGLLIADGGLGGVLEIQEHEVRVVIDNGIAVTRVTQVFKNTENRQVEALYTFPVPKGASVANFSMWINGKEMVGEVLEKKRAREIYESYKQVKRDPGLLEQTDYKTFEMRIFPIAPQAEQKVEIAYYQELEFDHDWATYVYPLATVTRKGLDARTSGRFGINFEIRSAVPLVEMESPSHGEQFAVAKHSAEYWQAALETKTGSLERDVVLSVRAARPKTGIDMITSRSGREDGTFSLALTAGQDLAKLDEGMDYVFVVDISGSMGDDGKLAASRNSVNAFVRELGPEDRFEVLTFNVQATTLFGALQPANPDTLGRAAEFLAAQQGRGGTVLNPAMSTAYKYAATDRQLNVIILSDGMTEQSERRTLLELIRQRPSNSRVFCIGVGNEVNKPLLEQLAEDSGGLAAFVSQGDHFERQARAFRRKLTTPAASNLSLKFNGIEVYDLEPRILPNLYFGAPVRVYGRYRGDGPATVELTAEIRGREFKQNARLEFPREDAAHPEIERMWAWRRVDRLLKEADRSGAREPVLQEIVRLGEGYSIVTEYTSFLVLENDAEYQRWQIDRRNALRIERDRAAQQKVRDQFDSIRTRAAADLGPQAAHPVEPAAAQSPTPSNSTPAPAQSQAPRNSRSSNQSWDLDLGTGPVGPLFVLLSGWLARRKRVAA
jgi:Ca-activated chloride channel family protein